MWNSKINERKNENCKVFPVLWESFRAQHDKLKESIDRDVQLLTLNYNMSLHNFFGVAVAVVFFFLFCCRFFVIFFSHHSISRRTCLCLDINFCTHFEKFSNTVWMVFKFSVDALRRPTELDVYFQLVYCVCVCACASSVC